MVNKRSERFKSLNKVLKVLVVLQVL